MWITPKTDWVQTDYFNPEDYNRIVGNINHIKGIANKLLDDDFAIAVMKANKTYSSIMYAKDMNDIENSLETINQNTYIFDIGDTKSYVNNGSTPIYSEFNRIESATLKLYKTLISHKELIRHIPFTLGGSKIWDVPRVTYRPYNRVMAWRLGNDKTFVVPRV